MTTQMVRSLVAVAFTAGAVSSAHAAAPFVATFDTDAQGFVGSTTSTVQIWQGTGGNPDGHLTLRRELSEPDFDLGTRTSTTAQFIGNYAAAGINGVGFDINVGNFSLDALWIRVRQSVAVDGWHYNFGALAPNANAWEDFDIAFDPTWDDATAISNGWVQEDVNAGSFAAAFANVNWLEVRAITNNPSTSLIVEIDNVRLVPAPAAAGLALMGMGVSARRCRR